MLPQPVGLIKTEVLPVDPPLPPVPTYLSGWLFVVHVAVLLMECVFFFFLRVPCDRCLEQALIYPPENPILCHSTKALNDTFVIECCNSHNMCNKELRPLLHVRKGAGRFFFNKQISKSQPFIYFFILACQHFFFSFT